MVYLFYLTCLNITEAEDTLMPVGHSYFCISALPVIIPDGTYIGPLALHQRGPDWPGAHWIAITSVDFTLYIRRSFPAWDFYVYTHFSHTCADSHLCTLPPPSPPI